MNRFCDPHWLGGGDEASGQYFAGEFEKAIPRIRAVLQAFRDAGALVVHVVNAKWTVEGREVVPYARGRDYDLFDTHAMSVIDELAPIPGEIMIRKVASSAFTATGLDFLLHNAGIENVVITGQYGNACCFYSLIHSREAGFSNFWVVDALVYGGDLYKNIIAPLVGAMWAKLTTSEQIAGALQR
jgi:nicotinamidase-related amidase